MLEKEDVSYCHFLKNQEFLDQKRAIFNLDFDKKYAAVLYFMYSCIGYMMIRDRKNGYSVN